MTRIRSSNGAPHTAGAWAGRLACPDDALRRVLRDTYGPDDAVVAERIALWRHAAGRFVSRFGDVPVRLFRSPGRLNLRGMHVDTHGGYLNLMTHQRETVVVVSPSPDDCVTFANVDATYDEVSFHVAPLGDGPAFGLPWLEFIMDPGVRADVDACRGHWGNYVRGCFLSAQHRFPGQPLAGIQGVVGSDVPRGAALSSSAALCVSLVLATLGCNGLTLDNDALIQAAQDGEWYTGSRCGLSDQAAMVIGGRGELVNVALDPGHLDTSSAVRIPFPDPLRVLVINSYTERSLSGAALADYTRNRFAYSLALEIFRQEMRIHGMPEPVVASMNRLANVSAPVFEAYGGTRTILELLGRIPEEITLSELRKRYDLPDFERSYAQYFATVPEDLRPKAIRLRGPLLFGIAESERARVFAQHLEAGAFEQAGMLMTAGHDGDRRCRHDIGDAAIKRLIEDRVSLEWCPGVYGASSPILDFLVDIALDAGALGASLTGAGMAGTVLALCYAQDAEAIADALRARMATEEYARRSGRTVPLDPCQIKQGVVVNTATACAGELRPE